MNIGLSMYFGSGIKECMNIIDRAAEYGIPYIFTSLIIPEESIKKDEIKNIFDYAAQKGVSILPDVNDEVIKHLELKSIYEFKDFGVDYLRLDDGFSIEETIKLLESFKLIINASTVTQIQLEQLKEYLGLGIRNLIGCHNYYPKINTGLSEELMRRQNELLHKNHIQNMAFVAGNDTLRGPVYGGLSTLERHRNASVCSNILDLHYNFMVDWVFIGDMGVQEADYPVLSNLVKDNILIKCKITNHKFDFLYNQKYYERKDIAERVVRVLGPNLSRGSNFIPEAVPYDGDIKKGSICVVNDKLPRYAGDIEIAKVDLPHDETVNVIGTVLPGSIDSLQYLCKDTKFIFLKA